MSHHPPLASLSERLGYEFRNPSTLEIALTHRSVQKINNERLEFLGDSIVNFIIAEALFHKVKGAAEGDLSRMRASLVNGETLAQIALEFGLGQHLRLGVGELKSGGAQRHSILADAVEAIIAAIYLDSDLATVQTRVLAWYQSRLDNLQSAASLKDPKTRLQEYLQAEKQCLPEYLVESICGEDHEQEFHVLCQVAELSNTTKGVGASRRKAEQAAADAMLNELIGERE